MLGSIRYCPILHTRSAEMKALLQLPAATKDGLFPLIVGRPWPNAKHLVSAWNKVSESIEGRRYALDLDRTRADMGGNLPANDQFDALFSPSLGYSNYYTLLSTLPDVIPVLRIDDFGSRNFIAQAEHVQNLDRGLVVRLEYGQIQNPIAVVDAVYQSFEIDGDVVFIIDAGWSVRDLIGREAWAASIIARIIQYQPEAEIVIAGSSFPDQFTNLGERGVINVAERRLFAALRRRFNAATLIYGDWASTRPPRESTPMINVPRIDLPTPNEWIAFRRDKETNADEDYTAIARRMMVDRAWPRDLRIWGTYMISSTAEGLPEGIHGAATAAAVRVNIHLHRQRFFDDPGAISDGDEPFIDV